MKIIWTKTADRNYRKNLDFLKKEWDYKTLKDFIDKVDKCIKLVEKNPSIGRFDIEIGCNKFLIVKQIYMYYEVSENILYIHNFWNNKREL